MLRTHTCGELTDKQDGEKVILCGWISNVRDHGGKTFIDIRDRYGFTQVIADAKAKGKLETLRREDCVQIEGKVQKRISGKENKKIKTGKVELIATKIKLLNKSKTPPIEIEDRIEANDEMRLKYRFLDLRRPIVNERIVMRHKLAQAIREYMTKENFLEIETPLLVRQTPEGARDYLVPSRVNKGKMYALPQSPQLYKQILMVAGMDRYFQIVKCFRDEDLRSDRQPEFTQLDIEMSFADENDLFTNQEGMQKFIFKKLLGVDVKTPFPRMDYHEAMDRFGSDKPDLRFDLELKDVTSIAHKTDFQIFKNAEYVTQLTIPKNFSRKEFDALVELAKTHGAGGLAFANVIKGGLDGGISKFLNPKTQTGLIKAGNGKEGDTLLFVADNKLTAQTAAGQIRLSLGKELKLANKNEYNFCWITGFPLFEWNEDIQLLSPMHHAFTAPNEEDIPKLKTDPGQVMSRAYDLVLNGWEIGGGSVRTHKPELLMEVLGVMGITEKEAERKFGFLFEALQYGAPPHLGMAYGFDRLSALMSGLTDIREVIAFPKNKKAENPMDGAPSYVEPELLKELNLTYEDDD